MQSTWEQVSWHAAVVRNIHLKKSDQQSGQDINPWGRKPAQRQPFNLGSIDVLAKVMQARR